MLFCGTKGPRTPNNRVAGYDPLRGMPLNRSVRPRALRDRIVLFRANASGVAANCFFVSRCRSRVLLGQATE